jgi:hypothetical protein
VAVENMSWLETAKNSGTQAPQLCCQVQSTSNCGATSGLPLLLRGWGAWGHQGRGRDRPQAGITWFSGEEPAGSLTLPCCSSSRLWLSPLQKYIFFSFTFFGSTVQYFSVISTRKCKIQFYNLWSWKSLWHDYQVKLTFHFEKF